MTEELKKPRVIRVSHSVRVGKEREGLYWIWCGDNNIRIVNNNNISVEYMEENDYFQPSNTYQKYQGEIPEIPKESTAEEKLEKLIAAAEVVAYTLWPQGFCKIGLIQLSDLIEEFKEES